MRRILLAAAILAPSTAFAHITLVSPLRRLGDQKAQHCGDAAQVRDPARVTEFLPGETITVTWMETINHPGWFRIAFQPDGEIFPIPPASNGPDQDMSGGGCNNFPTENLEGMTDPTTGAMILKDRIADGTSSVQVTLPNMECDNCTLQFIQVMIDKCDYTTAANSDDIYFNCADLRLTNTPTTPPDGAPTGDDAGPGGGGGGGSVDGGGCSTGAGAGALAALALVGLRRRRRAR